MGGGKVKTGIKIVDDTANTATQAVSDVSNGLNNVGAQIGNGLNNVGTQINNGVNNALVQTNNGLNNFGTQVMTASTVTDTVRDLVAGAGKNIERNTANLTNGLGLAIKGDFTGFDRTLIDAAMTGLGAMVNPDDTNAVTGTTTAEQQLTKKAEQEAQRIKDDEVRTAQESTMSDIRSVISGQIGARMRGPGRDMTLLGMGGSEGGNTLLTIARGR